MEQWRHMDRDLYLAVTSNNVQEFKALISQNADLLTQKTPKRRTVLHLAAKHGHRDMVNEICAHQCSFLFTQKDAYGDTPLHTAANYGHTEVTGLLIELARKVGTSGNAGKTTAEEMLEARSNQGQTALYMAVSQCHLGVVEKLIQAYPDLLLVASNSNWSPLYLASWNGDLQIVKCILSAKVQRSESFHSGPQGANPLHVAIIEEHQDVVETLLQELPEYAKCINDKGRSPLLFAAGRGMLSVVSKLLKLYPSAVYQTHSDGDTPLHEAARCGKLMVFKEIIRYCPDSWKLTNAKRENVLHIAVLANQLDVVEYIMKTSEFDQLINIGDNSGNRPLHLAVQNDYIWIVFLLLEYSRLIVRLKNYRNESAFDIISAKVEWGIPFSQKAAIWLAIKKAGKYDQYKKDRYATCQHTAQTWIATANTLLVVAALITTVSFAAIFTMPGGYETEGKIQGLSHYRNKTLFRIFLLLDSLAMFSSLVAALLVIVANWTDTLGLTVTVPWALNMTALSFLSMCSAFSWAVGIMVKFNWVLVVVAFLNAVIACLVVSFLFLDSPAYCYWRIYRVFRRVKKLVTRSMHVWTVLKKQF